MQCGLHLRLRGTRWSGRNLLNKEARRFQRMRQEVDVLQEVDVNI